MTEPNEPISDIDTFANAVTFWTAARTLIQADAGDTPKPLSAILMLLCFAVENGIKTVLQHRKHEPHSKWSHSHDLKELRLKAADYGLHLTGASTGVIDAVSPFHAAHLFRYPKKMPGNFPSVNKIEGACDELLRLVGALIDLNDRLPRKDSS